MQMSVTTNINYTTVYVGMDVHKDSFTLCSYHLDMPAPKYTVKVPADYRQILKYIERMRDVFGDNVRFICGYEAGCLGYSLYHDLTRSGIECIILAPTTMHKENGKRIKTDARDASLIATCLAYRTYHKVYVPDREDEAVKEYLRMRRCSVIHQKKLKQQILSFCLRQGFKYTGGSNWTVKHLDWLAKLELSPLLRETLDEFLISLQVLIDKIKRLDDRIEELAEHPRYAEGVKRLCCFKGIQTKTALSSIVEVGDFHRFKTAERFAAYLGLTPGESASGDKEKHLGITKAGNIMLRTAYVEAAQCYNRGKPGVKSKLMSSKQKGVHPALVAYTDKANERLQRKYYKLIYNGKKPNVAKVAIARELACFIWGVMTENFKVC